MTRPLIPDNSELALAQVRQRVSRLERRPGPQASGPTGYMTPPSFEIGPLMMRWLNASGVGGTLEGFSWTTDTSLPTDGYLGASSVDDHILLGFPLGPYGSIWSVGFGYHQNTSGGTFRTEWGTTKIDEAGEYALGWPSDPSPFGTETSVAHPITLEGSANEVDFYHTGGDDYNLNTAGSDAWVWVDNRSEFVIAGDNGSKLSANGVAMSSSPWPDNYFNGPRAFMTGGGDPSVYWWMRLRITSAGPVRIGWIKVYRRDADRHKFA
jgi:hypothetical protein